MLKQMLFVMQPAISPDRLDRRAGSYKRKLLTTTGEVELPVSRLRRLPFETQIIQRYQTKQSSVEEALIEMYLAGVSARRVEDITEAFRTPPTIYGGC